MSDPGLKTRCISHAIYMDRLRRAKAYVGTTIVVHGGIYVPSIVIPSGPDSRFAPVGIGG